MKRLLNFYSKYTVNCKVIKQYNKLIFITKLFVIFWYNTIAINYDICAPIIIHLGYDLMWSYAM